MSCNHNDYPVCDPVCDPTLWTELGAEDFEDCVEYRCNKCGYVLMLSFASETDTMWIEAFDLMMLNSKT